jgi:hypothetical protein
VLSPRLQKFQRPRPRNGIVCTQHGRLLLTANPCLVAPRGRLFARWPRAQLPLRPPPSCCRLGEARGSLVRGGRDPGTAAPFGPVRLIRKSQGLVWIRPDPGFLARRGKLSSPIKFCYSVMPGRDSGPSYPVCFLLSQSGKNSSPPDPWKRFHEATAMATATPRSRRRR